MAVLSGINSDKAHLMAVQGGGHPGSITVLLREQRSRALLYLSSTYIMYKSFPQCAQCNLSVAYPILYTVLTRVSNADKKAVRICSASEVWQSAVNFFVQIELQCEL